MRASQLQISQRASGAQRPSYQEARDAIRRILLGGPRAKYGQQDKRLKALRDRVASGMNPIDAHLLDLLDGRPDAAMTMARIIARRSLPALDVIPFPVALEEETAAQADADCQQIAAMRAQVERRPLLAHEKERLRAACLRQIRTTQRLLDSLDAEEIGA